jgi:RimJ/RimL family protein N-acetyltransferase
VEAVVAGIGNYDVARWLGRVPFPYGPEDARTFIEKSAKAKAGTWFIHDETGLIGGISVDGELGYWLARPAWSKGYATEAGDAAIDAHFADPRAEVLESGHYLDNSRSARVLEKLGFVPLGLREVTSAALGQTIASRRMVLTRARWQARRRYRLATKRLRLRELRPSDARAVARITADPRVAPMLATVPAEGFAPQEADRWIEAARYRGRPGFRAAITGRSGRLLGTVGLLAAPKGPLSCSWFVAPKAWGRGIATEAAGAFLADTMDRFEISTLWAYRFADNPASGRVMEKLGFVEAGVGTGTSAARLEAAPVVIYRLWRSQLKAVP